MLQHCGVATYLVLVFWFRTPPFFHTFIHSSITKGQSQETPVGLHTTLRDEEAFLLHKWPKTAEVERCV